MAHLAIFGDELKVRSYWFPLAVVFSGTTNQGERNISAKALYEAMGHGGYIVEGVWESSGRLYVQVVMRSEVLWCRLAQVTNS